MFHYFLYVVFIAGVKTQWFLEVKELRPLYGSFKLAFGNEMHHLLRSLYN